MRPGLRRLLALAFSAALAAACGGGSEGGGPVALAGTPTFFRDVEPIVQARCQGCHASGGVAPFPLVSLEDVRSRAGAVAAAVEARVMPPWPPSDRGLPLLHDRSLAPAEIDTLTAWAAAGAPPGDPADHVERRPEVPSIRADVELAMVEPYLPRTDPPDDYRCFVLQPDVPSTGASVTGIDVVPGLPHAVHHVILWVVEDDPGTRARLAALDAADPGPGYTCFGGSGLDEAPASGAPLAPVRMLGGWAPGAGAAPLPAGTGIPLPARSRLLMQVHYHAHGGGGAAREADVSRVRLQLARAPVAPAVLVPILDDGFVVPPGVSEAVVETTLVVGPPAGGRLHAVFPHMHLRGRSVAVSATVGGVERLLVEIPRWDFRWQGGYTFRESIRFGAGDAVHLRCVYDNSAANQPVVDGVRQPPRELRWGEGTDDEMCLAFLYVTP